MYVAINGITLERNLRKCGHWQRDLFHLMCGYNGPPRPYEHSRVDYSLRVVRALSYILDFIVHLPAKPWNALKTRSMHSG